MPADRLLHARLGHSAKVSSLSDLEYRVWTTYLLAADDFGVMRAEAVAFQAAHDALGRRPAKVIGRCIERLVETGLVEAFVHQGARYLYQVDWQDFQRVRYPLRTLHPLPATAEVSPRTRHLWSVHPGGVKVPAQPKAADAALPFVRKRAREAPTPQRDGIRPEAPAADSRNFPGIFPESSRNSPGIFPTHARGCETANGLRLTADLEEGGAGGEGPDAVAARAAAFVERYRAELYPRHRGVAYAPTRAVEASDAESARRLCAAYGAVELERLTERFLTTEGDRFLEGRTRTVSMLLSMAPALAERLRADSSGGEARSADPRAAYDAVIERARP